MLARLWKLSDRLACLRIAFKDHVLRMSIEAYSTKIRPQPSRVDVNEDTRAPEQRTETILAIDHETKNEYG